MSDPHQRAVVLALLLHAELDLAHVLAAHREAFPRASLEASRQHPVRSADPLLEQLVVDHLVDPRAVAARLLAFLAVPLGLEADLLLLLLAVALPPLSLPR